MADEYQRSGKLKSQAGGNCHINLWEGGGLYDIYGGLVNTPTAAITRSLLRLVILCLFFFILAK